MRIRVPPKRICEKFLIIYELQGAQKAVNYLTEYCQVKKMRIVLDGRKVGKNCVAFYEGNRATFKTRGLNRRTILHELFHHLVDANGFEMPEREEERRANVYVRAFLKRVYEKNP